MIEKNKILVPFGEGVKLAKLFRASRPFVRKVLRGEVTSDPRAVKIREFALMRGGIEISKEGDSHAT